MTGFQPTVPLKVTVQAQGFGVWTSSAITLPPGQFMNLSEVQLALPEVETSVNAIMPQEIALQQVKAEEKQRILGVIPNFYVVYGQNPVPLTTKMKYQLAWKAGTDTVTIAAAALLAGVDQAANTPDYVQGMKGYGERFGALYANGFIQKRNN